MGESYGDGDIRLDRTLGAFPLHDFEGSVIGQLTMFRGLSSQYSKVTERRHERYVTFRLDLYNHTNHTIILISVQI